jgi:large subunit ribosomal protein L29
LEIDVNGKEIRELTDNEIQQRMQDSMQALRNFRIQMATGTVDNVRAARNARRDIARMRTILRERETPATKEAQQA